MVSTSFRLLELNGRLNKGENLNKTLLLKRFRIDSKTFQRDIDKLRLYYSEHGLGEINYDRKNNCYRLEKKPDQLTKKEIFALCKILIESRAFNKQEFSSIIDKILTLCSKEEARQVASAINNEKVNYLELQHGKTLINEIWELREAITKQQVICFDYERADKEIKSHKVKPVGIVFSEFYFYLLAYQMDEKIKYPTIFRIDRIQKNEVTLQHFSVPYNQKFSETEFKKRTQFMYSGELKTIRFEFTGVLEALLDKLPTAQIERNTEEGVIIRAEVFGNGISMWLKSQGEHVKVIGEIKNAK
ncbi:MULTISPECIES: helix-turn-helix transcriptional regulator [Lactococcus]|uniref:helix-turn-helix transcriptional regulator n=1 Tax=Lactococcus TaxID=1357 RepID=UPI002435B340|nr:WYL domain-containing protein [Lactococcus formosensis]MDG6143770.1 WYL domain-containing protein [Lactococcus formosensis]